MPPHLPLTFFALSFLMDFFHGWWKYFFRKIIENVQFAVQQEIFQKTLFFNLPPPNLGSVAQNTHA